MANIPDHIDITVEFRPLEYLMRTQLSLTQECFPDQVDDIRHMALGLGGEAGEVLNLVKKWDRGDFKLFGHDADHEKYDALVEEVTDALIYVLNLYAALGVSKPDEVLAKKTQYNRKRFGGRNADERA